jgi:hypothetical protein
MLPEEIIMQIAVGYSFRPNALPNRETRRVQGKWPSFLTNLEGLHDASVPTNIIRYSFSILFYLF